MTDTHHADEGQRVRSNEHVDEQVGAAAESNRLDDVRRQVVRQYRGEIMDYAAEFRDDDGQVSATVERAFTRAFASWQECGRAGNFPYWPRGLVADLFSGRTEA